MNIQNFKKITGIAILIIAVFAICVLPNLLATRDTEVDKKIVVNQLGLFIQALRQVPASAELREHNIQKVDAMSTVSTFNNVLLPMLKQRYKDSGNKEVAIKITNVVLVQDKSWEIDWNENSQPAGSYKAIVTIGHSSKFKDSAAMAINPLGLVVSDISILEQTGS